MVYSHHVWCRCWLSILRCHVLFSKGWEATEILERAVVLVPNARILGFLAVKLHVSNPFSVVLQEHLALALLFTGSQNDWGC